MKNSCLLTIGIPVYNGERFIRQTLDSLIVALKEFPTSEVEILVSDNCSTDKTSEIIEDYANTGKLLFNYFRNQQNHGYDRNIDLIAERAQGKYIWFLGCGDIAKPAVLPTIFNRLESSTYNYGLLNFDIVSEEKIAGIKMKAFPSDSDSEFFSISEVYSVGSGVAMAVSSNIVLKSAWLKAASSPLFEKGWCHIERIHSILNANDFPAFFISQPCFTLYRENNGWWTTKQVYLNFISYCRLIRRLRNVLQKRKYQKIESSVYPFALIHSVILAKSLDVRFDKAMIKSAMNEFGDKILFWLFVLPFFFIPSEICSKHWFLWIKNQAISILTRFRSVKRFFCD